MPSYLCFTYSCFKDCLPIYVYNERYNISFSTTKILLSFEQFSVGTLPIGCFFCNQRIRQLTSQVVIISQFSTLISALKKAALNILLITASDIIDVSTLFSDFTGWPVRMLSISHYTVTRSRCVFDTQNPWKSRSDISCNFDEIAWNIDCKTWFLVSESFYRIHFIPAVFFESWRYITFHLF